MANATAVLAERYKELGFRVIEGGRSNKLVVVNSVGLATNFNKLHRHVLRDIEQFTKSLSPDLDSVFSSHCIPAKYKDPTGRLLPCFDLTEVGFTTFALGYDPILRLRYVLAFEELQEELGLRSRSITRPIVNRLQQIQTQPELPFTSNAPDRNQRHLDCISGMGGSPDFGFQPDAPNYEADEPGFRDIQDYMDADAPFPITTHAETCQAERYTVTLRWKNDQPWYLRITDSQHARDVRRRLIPTVPQAMLSVENGYVPKGVVYSALMRFGMLTPIVVATLDPEFR